MPDFDVEAAASQIGSDLFGQVEDDDTPAEVTENVTDEPTLDEIGQEAQDTAENGQVELRPAPKSWPKEMHEYWSKTDPKVQEYWETREKQMLDGLDGYKTHAGLGKSLSEVAQPYQQYLDQAGVDLPKAVSYLLSAHVRLTQGTLEQRKAAYLDLGRNLGFGQDAGISQVDPHVAAAYQAAQEAQNLVRGWQTQQTEQLKQQKFAEVEEFAKDKPYFDEIADDIIVFINNGMALQDAYDRAMWANPVTRAKEQERLRKESVDAARKANLDKANAAKKASSINIRSRDTGKVPTEPHGSMDDTLKKTLEKIREGAR